MGAAPSLHHGQRPGEAPFQTLLRQICQGGLPGTRHVGRELLSLNLSFGALLAQPPEAMPGEARQAFRALGALPPLRYRAPDAEDHTADPRCTPRGDIPHGQLLRMPLLHNPMLDATPAERRTTPAEEQEMLRWAAHGVTRVTHVLNAAKTRVLTFQELCTHYPIT